MKNIVLLNIVSLFDYEHALSFLFKLSQRSRNHIPKQLPYLQSNLSHYKEEQPKRYYRKLEHLYYDYGYRFLIQTQLTKQNTKKFVLKHISQMNEYNTDSIQMYKQTWHKYDIRKLRVEIHVIDPSKADELIELAKEQFPHYEIELVIKENLSGSLKLFYLPQVLEIGTKSEIAIELSLLSGIKYIKIQVQHQPFNLILKAGPKLGENTSISFHFGELKSKVKNLEVEGFAENYKDSIDFALCNYKIFGIDPLLIEVNKLFYYLKDNNYQLSGEILFEFDDPQVIPCEYHELVREYYANFKFDELSLISEYCNLAMHLDEVRCNSFIICGEGEEYGLRLQKQYIIEEKLSLLINNAGEWFTEFVENFEGYPGTLIIEIFTDESLEEAAYLLQIIHPKKPDLKVLKVIIKSDRVFTNSYYRSLYKAIGLFSQLEELEVPILYFNQSLIDLLRKSIFKMNTLQKVKLVLQHENPKEKILKMPDWTGFMRQFIKMGIRSIKCENFQPTVNVKRELIESQKPIKLKGAIIQ